MTSRAPSCLDFVSKRKPAPFPIQMNGNAPKPRNDQVFHVTPEHNSFF